jgi:hypothetical protein
LALDGLFNSRLPIIISPDRRPDPAKGTWEINPAMKRISAPTMIEDGRLSGNELAARWFDETARHQFLRECELEGLITERTAYGPFGYLTSSTPIGQNWPTSHAQLLRFKHRHRLLTGGRSCMLFGTRAVIVNSFPMEEASALLLSIRLRPRDNSQLLNPIIS